MKNLCIIVTLFQFVLSTEVLGSGCGNIGTLVEESSVLAGFVEQEMISVSTRSGRLVVEFDRQNIAFLYFENGISISVNQFSEIETKIKSGQFRINYLERKNYIFSYFNDCDGFLLKSSGVYKLDINIGEDSLIFVYPSIHGHVSGYSNEALIPLFEF